MTGAPAPPGAGPAAADLQAAVALRGPLWLPHSLQGRAGSGCRQPQGAPATTNPTEREEPGTRQAQGTADRERLVYKPTKARPHIKIAPSASRSKPAKLQLLQHQPQRDRTRSVTTSGPCVL